MIETMGKSLHVLFRILHKAEDYKLCVRIAQDKGTHVTLLAGAPLISDR